MTALPEHSGRSPPAAASAGPMYSGAANVNEARKALWDKTSGLQVQLGVAPPLM